MEGTAARSAVSGAATTPAGRWVVEAAFRYLARRYHEGDAKGKLGTFFINLSGASLSDDEFFHYVRDQLREHKLPSGTVCFEITETAAIANLANAVDFMREIKREG